MSNSEDNSSPWLFDPPESCAEAGEPAVRSPEIPVWTHNKARLIMRYLQYFVYITKHGTYIDGFAGPQRESAAEDSWAAKLVLESEPRRMRHFHLCDVARKQVGHLRALRASQADRDISVYEGDFNIKVHEILDARTITEKEATFCLLDQRTFECEWQTVKKLAAYKQIGHKIELFYFLANGWFERGLSAQRDVRKLESWWGRSDWSELRNMSRDKRREAVEHRMRNELGYKSAKAWPIYQRERGGTVMYYMIHATDHPEAPHLMARAYAAAVRPLATEVQTSFWPDPKTPDNDPSPIQAAAENWLAVAQ